MRFIGLVLIILSVPIFYAWLKQNRHHQRYFWFALGFLPFVVNAWNLDAAIISWALWPGHTRGVSISFVDSVALAVLLSRQKRLVSTPFLSLIIAYMLAAALSVVFSDTPQASFFYVWQLTRMLLLFAAVSNVCMDRNGPMTIVAGLICGIMLQAGFVAYQKADGAIQATGTVGHQNLLGMATHFVVFPALALLFAGGKSKLPLLGLVAGLIVVASGASRATIGLAGIGVVLLILLSMMRKPTGRKTGIAVAGLVALAASAPVALASLEQRYAAQPIQGAEEERAAFERAAMAMWSDYPMGVGANRYVVVANAEGYSERAGVIWNSGSRSANVHNAYLLAAAETGFLGLIAFILLIYVPIFAALRYAWADKRDPRGDLALGFAVTLIIVAVHSLYEWAFVTDIILSLYALCVGMTAGMIMQRKVERRAVRAAQSKSATGPPVSVQPS